MTNLVVAVGGEDQAEAGEVEVNVVVAVVRLVVVVCVGKTKEVGIIKLLHLLQSCLNNLMDIHLQAIAICMGKYCSHP